MARKNDTRTQFEIDFDEYKSRLTDELKIKWKNIATTIFKWSGFANDFIGDEIERKLYELGSVVFFVDEEDGVQKVLKWAMLQNLNIYGYPVAWQVIGIGFNKKLTEDNSVMIWNNKLKSNTFQYIDLMVDKMVNVELTTDINVNAIRTPFVFSGDQSRLLTFKNIMKKILGSEPVIYNDSSTSMINKEFQAINTGVKFEGLELSKLYDYYEGRCMNHLGLKWVNSDKKERMVVSEANSKLEYSNSIFASMYDMRKQACEKINKMFGLNIKVEINPAFVEKEENNKKEDKKDGKIHD